MTSIKFTRRAALATLAATIARPLAAQEALVPWSSGTEKATTKAPFGAVDCHFHTYDKRFPIMAGATLLPDDALPDDYRMLQKRIGTTRGVIIQPSTYGTDNRLQIASSVSLGRDNFRVVAVVAPDVTDAELRALHEQGVRGVRFNLGFPGVLKIEHLEPLAPRLAAMGWVCQINMRPKQIEDNAALLAALPGRLVFDHLAQIPQPNGLESVQFKIMRAMLDKGRTWIKLSGAYVSSKQGAPDYSDAGAVAAAYVKAAPERLVWASDWPHPSELKDKKPNDAHLFDLFAQWAGGEPAFRRILVDNPVELYDLPKVKP